MHLVPEEQKPAHLAKILLSPIHQRSWFPRLLPMLYLAICIPTVLFLVFARQPLSNPDELSHISRAYQISNGTLLTEEATPGLHPLGKVDHALFLLGGQVKKRRFESLYTASPVFERYRWSGNELLKRFNSSVYFPAAFLPQAIAIKIARHLDLSLVHSLQLTSFLNAAFCLLVSAFAIHWAKEGKFFIAFVGALPMTLHQFASSSPDGILIASSLLLVAIAITALAQARGTYLSLLGVIILGSLMAATKLPYIPLALAALIAVWCSEHRSARQNLIFAVGGIVMVAVPIVWMELSNAGSVNHNAQLQTDAKAQIAFLLAHPGAIVDLAISTLSVLWKAYLVQMIGVLGWLDAPLHPLALVIVGVGLAAMVVLDGTSAKPVFSVIFLGATAAAAAFIFASLYVARNVPQSRGPILGVQGRYFLPILPFLALLIPKPLKFDALPVKVGIFTICGVAGSLATMAAITSRYYLGSA